MVFAGASFVEWCPSDADMPPPPAGSAGRHLPHFVGEGVWGAGVGDSNRGFRWKGWAGSRMEVVGPS
jgi:hypothetical protein